MIRIIARPVLDVIIYEFFNLSKATQYLTGLKKAIHKLQESAHPPPQLKNFTYYDPPPLSAMCPLCGAEVDTWAHPILRCRHRQMVDLSFATHQDLFEVMLHAIIKHTDLSQWFVTADLPGHHWHDMSRTLDADAKATYAIKDTDDNSDEDEDSRTHEFNKVWADRMERLAAAEVGSDSDGDSEDEREPASFEQDTTWDEVVRATAEAAHELSSDEESDATYVPSVSSGTETDSETSENESEVEKQPSTGDDRTEEPPGAPQQRGQRSILDWLTEPDREQDSRADEKEQAELAAKQATEATQERTTQKTKEKQKKFKATGILEFDSEDDEEGQQPQEPNASGEEREQIKDRLKRAGGTPCGLPASFGIHGIKCRPDGLIIEGLTWNNRKIRPSRAQFANHITVHIFEFTRTSEAYYAESREKKKLQHKELTDALSKKGIKWKLHILQMGCRGFMPQETKRILKSLGNKKKIGSNEFEALYSKLSKIAISRAYSMVRLRSKLERDPGIKHPNVRSTEGAQEKLAEASGRLAVQAAKKKQRELRRKQGRSKKPPGE